MTRWPPAAAPSLILAAVALSAHACSPSPADTVVSAYSAANRFRHDEANERLSVAVLSGLAAEGLTGGALNDAWSCVTGGHSLERIQVVREESDQSRAIVHFRPYFHGKPTSWCTWQAYPPPDRLVFPTDLPCAEPRSEQPSSWRRAREALSRSWSGARERAGDPNECAMAIDHEQLVWERGAWKITLGSTGGLGARLLRLRPQARRIIVELEHGS